MTNRRGLLQTFCAAGTVGIAGCGGTVRGVLGGDPPVEEPCKDGTWNWPPADGEMRNGWFREDYDLGTVDAVVPVDEGFVIREGTTSGLSLIR